MKIGTIYFGLLGVSSLRQKVREKSRKKKKCNMYDGTRHLPYLLVVLTAALILTLTSSFTDEINNTKVVSREVCLLLWRTAQRSHSIIDYANIEIETFINIRTK